MRAIDRDIGRYFPRADRGQVLQATLRLRPEAGYTPELQLDPQFARK
jgi:hypothetical protein